MRSKWFLFACCALLAAPAAAQNIAELRAQYQQTQEMLQQAESMGVDGALTSSLRDSLEGLRQSIDEMERDQQNAAQQSNAPSEPEPVPAAAPPPAQAEPNLAASACGQFGFTEDNYRTTALSGDGDVQIKSMCGQAYEFYSMYKRALAQRHPEAWKTYDAHRKASAMLGNFRIETSSAPGEGIHPDTKTAQQMVAEQQRAAATAAVNAPKRPPQAPPCRGCVTPQ